MIWGHLKPTPNSTTLTDVIIAADRSEENDATDTPGTRSGI